MIFYKIGARVSRKQQIEEICNLAQCFDLRIDTIYLAIVVCDKVFKAHRFRSKECARLCTAIVCDYTDEYAYDIVNVREELSPHVANNWMWQVSATINFTLTLQRTLPLCISLFIPNAMCVGYKLGVVFSYFVIDILKKVPYSNPFCALLALKMLIQKRKFRRYQTHKAWVFSTLITHIEIKYNFDLITISKAISMCYKQKLLLSIKDV
jgi:hypothetical protein